MVPEKPLARVLVIDDDLEWSALVTQALSNQYSILTAASGEDGLRIAVRAKPDIIILDVMMPGGKDGFATFCELKKDTATCKIPVVMITEVNEIARTEFSAAHMKQFLGEGPAGFLEKPVSAKRLLEEVRKLLA